MYDDIPKPTFKKLKTYTNPLSAQGVRNNMEWLKKHHEEYKGQWITINEGMFLGSNESFLELYKAMESSDQLPVALFLNLK